MKKVILVGAAVAAMLATGFTACKPTPPEPPKEIDIYVAGYDGTGENKIPKVWKNGKEIYALTTGDNTAYAYSLFVAGSDVYTAGYENNGTKNVAKVWKNKDEFYALSNGDNHAEARSVFISDGKVYTAGYEGNFAKY